MKNLPKPLPKLEKLLLDADVNPRIITYLRAVGFRVLFAPKVKVDYRNDVAIIKWCRRHDRICVCHDRYKDRKTKIRVYQEVYERGGQVIQISGHPGLDPLTSLGKILAHRNDWISFFQENDGMVLVHKEGMKRMPREYLLKNIQARLDYPAIPEITPKAPRRQRAKRRSKPIPPEQTSMLPE